MVHQKISCIKTANVQNMKKKISKITKISKIISTGSTCDAKYFYKVANQHTSLNRTKIIKNRIIFDHFFFMFLYL